MKRKIMILVCVVLTFTLSACRSTNTDNDSMYIQKAELSSEERELLEFVGAEEFPYIMDFIVDYSIQSMTFNTYELVGDEWILLNSGGNGYTKNEGRIGLKFSDIGIGATISIEGVGSTDYEYNQNAESDGLNVTTAYLSEEYKIGYEVEVPLVVQVHTAQNAIDSLAPEIGFYEPKTYAEHGYEKVYAITCTFSKNPVINE